MSDQKRNTRNPEKRTGEDVQFHYSRSERLQHRSGHTPVDLDQRRRTLTRRLIIILLDIVLVSSVYLIYVFFLQPDPSSDLVNGVRFSSSTGYFDEVLQIRVSAERLKADETPSLLSVEIYRSEIDGLLGSQVDTLSPDEGARRSLYFQLGPFDDPPEAVRIEIEMNGARGRLDPPLDDF